MPTKNAAAPKAERITLTTRDRDLLTTIAQFEGVMADYQLEHFFGASERTMRERLAKLVDHKYLQSAIRIALTRDGRLGTAYWLGPEGWKLVEGTGWPRGLQKRSRLNQVVHDVALNDVHLAMLIACETRPGLALETWRTSGEFHAFPEQIDFVDVTGRKVHRKILPDGYFTILRLLENGWKQRARYFLELDNGTEHIERIVREKVLPGLAYLAHPTYETRNGGRAGRWLVVINDDAPRMNRLMVRTRAAVGEHAKLVYFTTLSQVTADTVLIQPIWHVGDTGKPMSLIDLTEQRA